MTAAVARPTVPAVRPGAAPPEPIRVVPAPAAGPPLRPAPTGGTRTAAGRQRGDRRFVQDPLVVDAGTPAGDHVFGPQATSTSELPDATDWAGHIGQALVEVLTGVRPAAQILRWTAPEVFEVVARRGALAARQRVAAGGPARRRPAHRPSVRRVRVGAPVDGVAEAAAVVVDGPRVRALAFRLVGQDGRWRLTAVDYR